MITSTNVTVSPTCGNFVPKFIYRKLVEKDADILPSFDLHVPK